MIKRGEKQTSEKPSYMKGVEANCPVCKYWQDPVFCVFPGKLQIKNGFCLSLKARDEDSP